MRYRDVQEHLRAVGVVISKRGDTIRVNYFGGLEETAYYTESLEEAFDAGMRMARPHELSPSWMSCRTAVRAPSHMLANTEKADYRG